jgi:hypothetical protein
MQQGGTEAEPKKQPTPAAEDAQLLLQFDAERPGGGIAALCEDAGVRKNSYYKILQAVKRRYES